VFTEEIARARTHLVTADAHIKSGNTNEASRCLTEAEDAYALSSRANDAPGDGEQQCRDVCNELLRIRSNLDALRSDRQASANK
jgi:hypothetical protein